MATRPIPNDSSSEVAELRAQLASREVELAAREQEIEAQTERIAALKLLIEKLKHIAYGRKSEKRGRVDIPAELLAQGYLFHADLVADADRMAAEKQVEGTITFDPPKLDRPRKGRRSKYPDHLPKVTTKIELEEEDRTCDHCQGELHEIGQEVTRELERLETTLVHEISRVKYACRACTDGVKTAPAPPRVIDKGLLGPGFLAHVAVERFAYHMPYNRLEKKFASEGLELSRSVLERSMSRCAEILTPVYEQLLQEVLQSPVIFTDDTPVTIARAPGKEGSSTGRVWTYNDREGRHFFDFTETRKREGPLAILGGYTGFIHADAYPGYDALFLPEGATEVACWAHTRRKFVEAEKTEPELAAGAIQRIGELYAIEKHAKEHNLDDEARRTLRQRHSVPIVNELFAWLASKQSEVLPKGPMGQASSYALTLKSALEVFLHDGRLEADNNTAERSLRPVAVGRKNWLFYQRATGGETAKVLLSLIRTADAIGINPKIYFRDVLLRIATESEVSKLTPHGWKEHCQAEVKAERDAVLDRFRAS